MVKSIDPLHFTAVAALFTALALFFFRSADDNRLFNWQWVFANRETSIIFPLLIAGIISAYVLAGLSLIERRPIIILVLFSFVATAIVWTEPELIMDASRYFTQAKHLEVYGIEYFFRAWGKEITVWTDLPAIPFLYGLIFRFFGENRIFIQVFTSMLFSGTLVLTYLIGKTLWSEELGFHAGMFLLGMPFLITQVPLMLVDVPTMFFLSLSIFTFINALNRGGVPMIVFAAIAIFFTVFSKYSALLMLSVLVVILLINSKKDPKVTFRRSSAVFLLAGLLIGAVASLKFDVLSEQITLLLGYQKPGLDRWGESFISTFLFQIHPFITLAAACSIIVAIKKRDWNYAIISWLVALVLVFDIKRIRYILPVFPLLALMAAYGLQNFTRKELRRFIVFVVVCSSLVLTVFAYLPFARRTSAENLHNAGEFLNDSGIEVVEIITLPLKDPVVNPSVSVALLDLFTQKRVGYQYHAESFPPPKGAEISSSRFTWEYTNPQYYAGGRTEKNHSAIMVIFGEANSIISPPLMQRLQGYRMTKRFGIASDPFRYKTIVEIYSPEQTLFKSTPSHND
jgi:4-amino-4-deoxy-L-arabinose transferase-like glycosyltransferase